jgi:hypothetical protein
MNHLRTKVTHEVEKWAAQRRSMATSLFYKIIVNFEGER